MTTFDWFIAGSCAVFFGNMIAWAAQEAWYRAEDRDDDDLVG